MIIQDFDKSCTGANRVLASQEPVELRGEAASAAHLAGLLIGGHVELAAPSESCSKMATTVGASRKHVELSLELKRKLIQEHEHGVPFTLLGKKYHIATSTAANIWRKKDFFLRSRMSGSRKRCNDRSKYKIVNQVTALFVKSMLERNHKIDGEVIKRFARTAAAQCNFKDFHGSNGWLDSFKKRENVCWVRRRGVGASASAPVGTSAGPSGHSVALSGGALDGPEGPSANSIGLLGQESLVAASATLEQQRRSDSPNLSTAAAAAAVAATAAAEHHHHHHQAQPGCQTLEASALREQHCHSPSSSSAASHCCWEEESCPRCTVAAAAAAIAALNSADSIHERDHEIEDWFHGIPFLCQFFEEYQSMHQTEGGVGGGAGGPLAPSLAASSSCPTSGAGSSQLLQRSSPQQTHHNHHHHRHHHHHPVVQHMSSFGCSLAASPPQSSSASSTCSSSQPVGMSSSVGSVPMLCGSGGGASNGPSLHTTRSAPGQLLNHSHAFQEQQPQQQPQQQQQQLTRSLSTSSSPTSTSGCFKASASMADMQMLDQKPVFSEPPQQQQQQHEASYQQSMEAFSDQLGSQEHLMEVNYADSATTAEQQQQQSNQLMECLLTNEAAQPSEPAGASSAPNAPSMVVGDYNSSDNEQEFYMAMSSQPREQHQHQQQQQQQQQQQYIDAQSQDDLLSAYQEEMSEHADHCCRYEQSTTIQLALANTSANEHQRQANQQQQQQQQSMLAHYQQQHQQQQEQARQLGGCYMDEYEYEHISTLCHYPLPSMAQLVHCSEVSDGAGAGQQAAAAMRDQLGAQFSADADGHQQQQQQQQKSRSGQLDGCRSSIDPASFTLVPHQQHQQQQQQQQQTLSNSSHSSSSSRLASATNSPPATSFANTAGSVAISDAAAAAAAANDANFQAQQQQHYYGSLLLYDHEQTIEQADHEEHNLLHNALMRSPEKLKLIDSIRTLLIYASNYNQKMLAPAFEIKRWIERDLEVALSDTSAAAAAAANAAANAAAAAAAKAALAAASPASTSFSTTTTTTTTISSASSSCPAKFSPFSSSTTNAAAATTTTTTNNSTQSTVSTSRRCAPLEGNDNGATSANGNASTRGNPTGADARALETPNLNNSLRSSAFGRSTHTSGQ